MSEPSQDWIEDSMRWHGRVLDGKAAHWCPCWDMPIDETCGELEACTCDEYDELRRVVAERNAKERRDFFAAVRNLPKQGGPF